MADKHTPSKGLQAVMDRLNAGHPVPMATIYGTNEVGLAEERANGRVNTNPHDKLRAGIQTSAKNEIMAMGSFVGKDENGEPVYAGVVKQGYEYHLMFGLPASGKSTIADQLSQVSQSRIMDSDVAKALIPEYDDGWGAAAVHTESKKILDLAMASATSKGENIIIPKIGTPPDAMIQMLQEARSEGYKIYAHCVDLDPNKAMGRMLGRFMSTGRYIPPSIAANEIGTNGENKVMDSFQTVVDSGILDGWTLWSNDVPKGEKPVLMAYSPNPDYSIQALIKDADRDVTRIIGKTPETPDEVKKDLDRIHGIIDEDAAEMAKQAEQLTNDEREIGTKKAMRQSNGTMIERLLATIKEDGKDGGKENGGSGPKGPGE